MCGLFNVQALLKAQTPKSEPADRIEEAKRVLDRVLGSRELFDAPLLVLANKQDAMGAWSATDVQENLGLGVLDSRPTNVMPASAVKGEGITESMRWLLPEIIRSSRASRLRQRVHRY